MYYQYIYFIIIYIHSTSKTSILEWLEVEPPSSGLPQVMLRPNPQIPGRPIQKDHWLRLRQPWLVRPVLVQLSVLGHFTETPLPDGHLFPHSRQGDLFPVIAGITPVSTFKLANEGS